MASHFSAVGFRHREVAPSLRRSWRLPRRRRRGTCCGGRCRRAIRVLMWAA